jgi:CRP-like cAMP-binding protein
MKTMPYAIFVTMSNPLINYLQLFTELSVDEQDKIQTAFQPRTIKEGEVLITPGKICRQLFFICEGILRIVKENDKGTLVTHFFLKENQFCTILYSFTNQLPTEESIQAAIDGNILVVGYDDLQVLYKQLPHIKILIEDIINKALLDKIQIRNTYLGQDAVNRYKLFIMRQPEIALRVALSDVASYLGITPQSLSRIRKNIS